MRRFFKFAVAGAIGLAVDAGVLHALTGPAQMNPFAARIPSFLLAVVVTWWLNRSWTFRHHGSTHAGREFLAYLSVQGAGALINFLVYAAILTLATPPAKQPVIALAIASAIAMTANFIGLNKWVFAGANNENRTPSQTQRHLLAAAALASCLTIGGIISVRMGQDVNFDLKNYHIYGPWAVFENRMHLDFFAAGIQTYFNPLLDFPHYAMLRAGLGEHPKLLAFLMGFPYGLLIFLTALVFFRALTVAGMSARRAAIAAAPALFLAATGSATVCQIGTVFNELQVACLIIAAVLAAMPTRHGETPSGRNLLLAGALCGVAAGLKLTASVYAPALMLGIMAAAPGLREAIRRAALGSTAWFAAFGLTYAWWGHRLHDLTGSPVFPMFNSIFHSPWLGDASFLDNRFKPHGWSRTLFYPLDWMSTNQLVAEPPFRDMRFFLAEVSLLILAGVVATRLIRKRLRPGTSRPAAQPTLRMLAVFLISGYAIWLGLFSILRYAVPLEQLTGLAILIGPALLLAHRRTSVFIAGMAICTAAAAAICAHTITPDFGHRPFGARYLDVSAPTPPPDSLILFIGPQGSYLAPTLSAGRRDVRFMSITSDAIRTRDFHYELWNKMTEIIRNHRGSTLVVLREEYPGTEKILPSLGLDITNTPSCPIRANIDSPMTIHFARSSSLSDKSNRHNEQLTANAFNKIIDGRLNHTNSELFTSGWSDDEPQIRWSDANRSVLTFVTRTAATAISIEGEPLDNQSATISLNGTWIFKGRIPQGGPARIPLPGSLLKTDAPNRIEFHWHDARQPGNGDPRLLAFAFRKVTLHSDPPPAP